MLALPALFALLCPALASLLPEGQVWAAVLSSGLRSLPPFLMAAWPVWGWGLSRRYRRPWRAAIALVGLPLMGLPPFLWPKLQADDLKIVAANVNAYSPDPSPQTMEEALAGMSADVVAVIEKRAMAIPGMVRVADNFDDPLPMESHGMAIFCKVGFQCQAEVTPEFGSATWQMPLGLARLPGGVCVLFVHGPPPAPFDAVGLAFYIQEVTSHLGGGRVSQPWGPCQAGDAALIMGDLNGVPGSAAYQALIQTGLEDHLAGAGVWGATWPAGGGWPPLPFFRLDHVLAGAAEVTGIKMSFIPGADHRAVIITVKEVTIPSASSNQ